MFFTFKCFWSWKEKWFKIYCLFIWNWDVINIKKIKDDFLFFFVGQCLIIYVSAYLFMFMLAMLRFLRVEKHFWDSPTVSKHLYFHNFWINCTNLWSAIICVKIAIWNDKSIIIANNNNKLIIYLILLTFLSCNYIYINIMP